MRIGFNEVRNNKLKSWLLVLAFIVLISIMGALFGIYIDSVLAGVAISVFIGLVYSLIVYHQGKSMILSMTGARPVTKAEFPHLYHAIEGLSVAAGIPKPKAYVIDDSALNAFATGKDPKNAAVVVTTGLLKRMDRSELEGVLAHEISHIKNYDIRMMMLATVLIGIVTLLSDFMLRSFLWGGARRDRNSGNLGVVMIILGLVLAVLAPIVGQMIRLAISRKREYMADASGALLTRYPPGLASALEKIRSDPDPLVDKANKATAHLFISTPFKNTKGLVSRLFSTHPPIEDRIRRLKEM